MPVWGWINLVLPLFRSIRTEQNVYFQAGQAWTSSYYPGIGLLLLALLSFRARKEHRVKFLWGIAIVGLVLALGSNGYVYAWIYKACPLLGFISDRLGRRKLRDQLIYSRNLQRTSCRFVDGNNHAA